MFHFLEEHPYVWQILFLLAHSHKALWNLSPVLRSCASVLLTHFESSRYTTPPPHSSLHYKFAVKVMQVIQKVCKCFQVVFFFNCLSNEYAQLYGLFLNKRLLQKENSSRSKKCFILKWVVAEREDGPKAHGNRGLKKLK